MDLHPIRYFVAVATELHVRRAAGQLNLSQPALSRAIHQLECRLGFQLFDRTTRRLALTTAGKRFLEGCQAALAALDKAAVEAADLARGHSGQLALGYTDIAIAGKLPGIVQSFRAEHPGVSLSVRHGSTRLQLADLADGKLDMGFVTGPLTRPDMASSLVQTDRFVVLLPRLHRLARRRALDLSELRDEAFVCGDLSDWTHYNAHLDKLCRSVGLKPRIVQFASNSEGILGMVACGIGISIQAESTQNYLRDGISVRPLRNAAEPIPTLAVWNKANQSAVVQFMVRHLSRGISG